jgi:imidazolonepropionase-like amidohydrolase
MNRTVITAERALIGRDLEVLQDPAILVEGDRIISVAPRTKVHPENARHVHCDGMTLLPGFIDSHVHIGFADPHDVLVGGVTTVRDLGWPPDVIFPMKHASAEAGSDGPLILAAGQMLTAPGGYPTRAPWAPPGTGLEVSGPEAAVAAVKRQADSGADVIKVALNPPVGPTLDLDTLTSIVDAAHALGLKTTGHVHGLAELEKGLEAGLHELAHMLLSDEVIPAATITRMVDQSLVVVPTLSVRCGHDLETAIGNLRSFLEAGGSVVYGTDLGNAGPRPGIDPLEIAAMASAGMSATDIVRSATVAAAEWLRLSEAGRIAEGAVADMIAVPGDPEGDIEVLSHPRFVMRSGITYRFPP